MRSGTATPLIAYLAVLCLVIAGGSVAVAGEAGPRDQEERQVLKINMPGSFSGPCTFADPFHLANAPAPDYLHWCGVVLAVQVTDPAEIAVLGGQVSNVGQGTAGTQLLAPVTPDARVWGARCWNTGNMPPWPPPNIPFSGRTISTSHSAPASVLFSARNTSIQGQNSDVDAEIFMLDIFHMVPGEPGVPPDVELAESDWLWVPETFTPQYSATFPPNPPDWDDPGAGFAHLDFAPKPLTTGMPGSFFYAKEVARVEVGVDHPPLPPLGDIRLYLEADPNNHVHEIHPNASETFDVYVCLDCFGGEIDGTRGTAFLLIRTFQGFKLSQTALLGGLDFGDAEADGWTIAAGADCVYPDADGVVCVGVIQYLYLGVPGTLDLAPHPGTGREVLDCDFGSHDYCIHANLGVSTPANPGEPDCECEPAAVHDMSWGAIKGLFR